MANKSDLIVIATARAKPGKEKALEKALRDVAAPTRAQPGSVAFSLFRSAADPSVIVGFERWSSPREHDRHLQGDHVKKLMAAMSDILAEPPQIVAYEILDEAPT
jgi:quinol monooxygenase YgiN